MSQDIIINGRPDMEDHSFGTTKAKKFPPFVYSTNSNGCLIHKVRFMELRWYEVESRDSLRWLKNPRIIIVTKCSQSFFLKSRNGLGFKMCEIPSPDAVMCGRCEGKNASFSKGVDSYEKRKEAHAKLGCMAEVV